MRLYQIFLICILLPLYFHHLYTVTSVGMGAAHIAEVF